MKQINKVCQLVRVMEHEKADRTEILLVKKKMETEYCTIKSFKDFFDGLNEDIT